MISLDPPRFGIGYNMKNKKTKFLILSGFIALVLLSCGENKNPPQDFNEKKSTEVSQVSVPVIPPSGVIENKSPQSAAPEINVTQISGPQEPIVNDYSEVKETSQTSLEKTTSDSPDWTYYVKEFFYDLHQLVKNTFSEKKEELSPLILNIKDQSISVDSFYLKNMVDKNYPIGHFILRHVLKIGDRLKIALPNSSQLQVVMNLLKHDAFREIEFLPQLSLLRPSSIFLIDENNKKTSLDKLIQVELTEFTKTNFYTTVNEVKSEAFQLSGLKFAKNRIEFLSEVRKETSNIFFLEDHLRIKILSKEVSSNKESGNNEVVIEADYANWYQSNSVNQNALEKFISSDALKKYDFILPDSSLYFKSSQILLRKKDKSEMIFLNDFFNENG